MSTKGFVPGADYLVGETAGKVECNMVYSKTCDEIICQNPNRQNGYYRQIRTFSALFSFVL